MKKDELGDIEQVDVREIWEKEDTDFTPWLAKEKNIRKLGLKLGIDLVVIAEEQDVGPFRADILCKDEATEDYVLIENQLEKTDHKHLGQLLTYATGLDAVTIVWIAKEFNDEHRETLDWLNKITNEDHNFFGVKIEVIQIEDKIAPIFNVVSKPNNWARSISSAATTLNKNNELTERKIKCLEFNEHVCNMIKEKEFTKLKTRKPRAQNWHTYPIGSSKGHLAHVFKSTSDQFNVEIYFPKDKTIIDEFIKDKDAIESEFGEKLDWQPLRDKVASRIALYRSGDLYKKEEWDEYSNWIIEKLLKFHEVFGKRLNNLE
jgi:hypothetical protein|tara:strand:- start:148 stop:1101 length:954 start_codon:yes stop_codon:yes gene_type:complete